MESTQALKWAGIYFGLWIVSGIVGAGIATAGVALGALRLVGLYTMTPLALRVALYPRAGAALIVLGALVWRFGAAAAFFKTVTTAIETRTAEQLDTETLKSDILAVLDDRLSDMHQDVEQTRRLVDRISRDDAADEFEFED